MTETAQSEQFDLPAYMQTLGRQARAAARTLSQAETGARNSALQAIADAILNSREQLKSENRKDMESGRKHGLDAALLDRLELTDARIDGHCLAGPGRRHQ